MSEIKIWNIIVIKSWLSSCNSQKDFLFIHIFNRYGFPTVVHINSNLGKVFVFHLTIDKVIPYQPSFTIPCESKENILSNSI